jgi:hypothetical protein
MNALDMAKSADRPLNQHLGHKGRWNGWDRLKIGSTRSELSKTPEGRRRPQREGYPMSQRLGVFFAPLGEGPRQRITFRTAFDPAKFHTVSPVIAPASKGRHSANPDPSAHKDLGLQEIRAESGANEFREG